MDGEVFDNGGVIPPGMAADEAGWAFNSSGCRVYAATPQQWEAAQAAAEQGQEGRDGDA